MIMLSLAVRRQLKSPGERSPVFIYCLLQVRENRVW
jgi:hypothetical protein